MWHTLKSQPLTRANFDLLLSGMIPVISMPNFARPDEMQSLKELLIEKSRRNSSIQQVTRFGISQYHHGLKESKKEYFRLAKLATKEQQQIFAKSFNPLERFMRLLKTVVEFTEILEENGYGRYYAGNGKLRNGYSPIHVDYAPQDSQDWAVGRFPYQLAWNVYLDIPESGGELLIWEKQWQPEDDELMVEDHYYFKETVIENSNLLSIKPQKGELLLINSRNYHAVANSSDRFAFGSFISVSSERSCHFWS